MKIFEGIMVEDVEALGQRRRDVVVWCDCVTATISRRSDLGSNCKEAKKRSVTVVTSTVTDLSATVVLCIQRFYPMHDRFFSLLPPIQWSASLSPPQKVHFPLVHFNSL